MKVGNLLYYASGDTHYRIEDFESDSVIEKGIVDDYFAKHLSIDDKLDRKEVFLFYVDNNELVVTIYDN